MKTAKTKMVREVAAPYRARRKPRKYAKCRMLTPDELGKLAAQMVAAHDKGDKVESERIKAAMINGWYGEVRA